MRHLGVRFIRHVNLARIATNDCPIHDLNNHIHVVDPQLDMRERFQGEKAIELSRSILARKLSLDLMNIRSDYDIWFKAFKAYCLMEAEQKSSLEKRHCRGNLLDSSAGFLSVLELPNDLDRDSPSTSKSEIGTVCDSTRSMIDDFAVQFKNNGLRRNFVQLRRLFLNALQRLFVAAVRPKPQSVSFPHLVRPAVVEACNLKLDSFPLVVEHDSYLSLTGVDLPSLISPMIKCQFSDKSNQWPLVFVTSGNVYPPVVSSHRQNDSVSFGQTAQLSLLIMDYDWHKCSEIVQTLSTTLHVFLAAIGLSFETADVKPPNLFLYERSAFSFAHGPSMELARFSNIGDYVSRRAQITKGMTGDFYLKMAFVRVNLDAIVKCASN